MPEHKDFWQRNNRAAIRANLIDVFRKNKLQSLEDSFR
jgi:hypothetical protein